MSLHCRRSSSGTKVTKQKMAAMITNHDDATDADHDDDEEEDEEAVELVFDDDIPEDLLDMETEESSWEFVKENTEQNNVEENPQNNKKNLPIPKKGKNPQVEMENPHVDAGAPRVRDATHFTSHDELQSMLQCKPSELVKNSEESMPSEIPSNDGMPLDGAMPSDADGIIMSGAGAMETKLHGGSYLVLNSNKLKVGLSY